MIEITFVDLVLLIWAALATSAWLSAKGELRTSKLFIREIMTNDGLRDEVVAHFKECQQAERTQ